jgi:hypothetical protein
MKVPRRRVRRLLLLGVAVVVLGSILSLLLASVGRRSGGAAHAAVFRFALTTALTRSAGPRPPLTRPQPPPFLLKAARRSAAFLADPRPDAAYWLLAPHHHEAVRLLMSAGVPGEQPVYVLAMVGHFTANVPSPVGTTGVVHARVVVSVFDANSHRVLDTGFSRRLPDLSRLGTVHNLRPYLLVAPLVPFLLGLDANVVGRVLAEAGFAPLRIEGLPRSAYGRYVVIKQSPAAESRTRPTAAMKLIFTCRHDSGISPRCSG